MQRTTRTKRATTKLFSVAYSQMERSMKLLISKPPIVLSSTERSWSESTSARLSVNHLVFPGQENYQFFELSPGQKTWKMSKSRICLKKRPPPQTRLPKPSQQNLSPTSRCSKIGVFLADRLSRRFFKKQNQSRSRTQTQIYSTCPSDHLHLSEDKTLRSGEGSRPALTCFEHGSNLT